MGDRESDLSVCLAATSGGHLAELERLVQGLTMREPLLVTVRSSQSSSVMPGTPKYFVRRILRNPANLLVNIIQSVRILLAQKPDVVISTGAGDVVPIVMLGSILGIPTVFAESIARTHKPSLTGRLIGPFADLVLIPWIGLRSAYPSSVHVRILAGPGGVRGVVPPSPSILILTGTGTRGFDRLLRAMDRFVKTGVITGRVFAQIGESSYAPENFGFVRYLPHPQLLEAVQDTDLVITHDGAGSMVESIMAGKHTIVVPRRSDKGELTYKSEGELARHLASLGWVRIVENLDEIPSAVDRPNPVLPTAVPDSGRDPGEVLAEFLDTVARNRRAVTGQQLGA